MMFQIILNNLGCFYFAENEILAMARMGGEPIGRLKAAIYTWANQAKIGDSFHFDTGWIFATSKTYEQFDMNTIFHASNIDYKASQLTSGSGICLFRIEKEDTLHEQHRGCYIIRETEAHLYIITDMQHLPKAAFLEALKDEELNNPQDHCPDYAGTYLRLTKRRNIFVDSEGGYRYYPQQTWTIDIDADNGMLPSWDRSQEFKGVKRTSYNNPAAAQRYWERYQEFYNGDTKHATLIFTEPNGNTHIFNSPNNSKP